MRKEINVVPSEINNMLLIVFRVYFLREIQKNRPHFDGLSRFLKHFERRHDFWRWFERIHEFQKIY